MRVSFATFKSYAICSMPADPDNAAIAAQLDEFAALLELADAQWQGVRAYRRAAELIRGLSVPVAGLVRAGRVQQLRGVGAGIERRLRELIETGEIAELTELRRSTPVELVAFAHSAGLSVELAMKIAAALELSTVAELKAAALAGRLREVPGIGPHREAKIVAALEQPERPRRPVLLPRARELTERIASALDGVPAGDARRWLDASTRLAVVATAEDASARFAALPEIVAMIDDHTGVTIDGIPIELVVAPPAAVWHGTRSRYGTGGASRRARPAAARGGRGRRLRRIGLAGAAAGDPRRAGRP